jgi:hypothetical protein
MHRTWNIKNSHGAWVVDAAITAMVECVIASVYQLLNFSKVGKFFSHLFKYFKPRVVKIALEETVLHEGFTA